MTWKCLILKKKYIWDTKYYYVGLGKTSIEKAPWHVHNFIFIDRVFAPSLVIFHIIKPIVYIHLIKWHSKQVYHSRRCSVAINSNQLGWSQTMKWTVLLTQLLRESANTSATIEVRARCRAISIALISSLAFAALSICAKHLQSPVLCLILYKS